MPESLLVNIRRKLGSLKRKIFKTNSALWFCARLDLSPSPDPDEKVSMVFDDLDLAVSYIRKKSEEFPWVYVQRELDAARRWNHSIPLISYEEEIAGYVKLARGAAYIDDFEDFLPLQSDEAFVCEVFISPEFRGKGLSKALLTRSIEWLRQNGFNYLFCHIPEWNVTSLNLFQGLGFKSIREICHFRLLNYRYYTYHPGKVIAEGRHLQE